MSDWLEMLQHKSIQKYIEFEVSSFMSISQTLQNDSCVSYSPMFNI